MFICDNQTVWIMIWECEQPVLNIWLFFIAFIAHKKKRQRFWDPAESLHRDSIKAVHTPSCQHVSSTVSSSVQYGIRKAISSWWPATSALNCSRISFSRFCFILHMISTLTDGRVLHREHFKAFTSLLNSLHQVFLIIIIIFFFLAVHV